MPIIHTDLDLGSLAEAMEEHAKAIAGEGTWREHKETVQRYWQEIARYWEGKTVAGVKIFQDGLPTDGVPGETIVKDLAHQGSINHKIIEHLMEKGAKLVRMEDPELLREEYLLTRELVQKKASLFEGFKALWRYRQRKDALLKARDAYILKRIDENLGEGETGICFLGAYHQIAFRLLRDIEVVALKNPQKVREYSQKLTSHKSAEELEKLAHYLTMPITAE